MIEVYKILTERYCKSVNLELELHKESVIREHNLKLVNSRCHYDFRKYSFAVSIYMTTKVSPVLLKCSTSITTHQGAAAKLQKQANNYAGSDSAR